MTSARRLCVAVDLEGYSRRSLPDQERAQERIVDLLDASWVASGVPRYAVSRQPTGDGELALLGEGVAETEALPAFLTALRAGLRSVNRAAGGGPRMRLRVAAHAGNAGPGPNGFVGHAVIRTCRLVASAALHTALAEHPGSDLGLIVSDSLFEDVAGLGRGVDLADWGFEPVHVVDLAKWFSAHAWLHVDGRAPGVAATVHTRAAAEPWLRIDVADGGNVGSIVQAGVLHGGLVLNPPPPRR
ncbi:hypothetical protein ACVGVM_06240 [Pseudonocardia bannensis]|uniref:Guanylate cyclase domain-containing protein n=1 Tax=Pseudonocardia bannensis TaxID=630973 RepID=A0A848DC22_9PSEU|nr:hypothetical protein [Pseudonocardia bannensis]NMH90181.1 hypothetical protein [Pseudonocardia bannensis]